MNERAAPLLFSLESGRAFAKGVAAHAGLELGQHEERNFGDGEHKSRPLQSVRNRDVFVVESLFGDQESGVNEKLVRLLFLLGVLRDAGAGRLTAVVPYLCYARKERQTKSRDPITTRYVAQLFESMEVDRFVTLDVHDLAAYQNSFRCRTEMLSAHVLFMDHFRRTLDARKLVVASPDVGGVKRAESFREGFEKRLGRAVGSAFLEKKRSGDEVSGELVVAGDLKDAEVIVIDDLIASGSTMSRAAGSLLRAGARRVHAAANHGIFSERSPEVLGTDEVASLVVTNSVDPFRVRDTALEKKLRVLSVEGLIGDAILRLHEGGSITELLEL